MLFANRHGAKASRKGRCVSALGFFWNASSVRTIHFGREQWFWECMCHVATDVSPRTRIVRACERSPKNVLKLTTGEKRDRNKTPLETAKWLNIVRVYSECSLSFASDKLVAIAGMAKLLDTSLGSEYLAGLWKQDLEHHLLWKARGSSPTAKDTMQAPSWSWASTDARVIFPGWIDETLR
jgi:hypothetical protein